MLDRQPFLSSDLLVLRPLRPNDFEALYAVAKDPLIWAQHPEPTRYQRGIFEIFFRTALSCAGALVAIDPTDNKIIGSSRFDHYKEERCEVEIGWTFLSRSHWGGKYNGEMKRLMLEYAFGCVQTVLFVIGSRNLRSRRAVEKIGGRSRSFSTLSFDVEKVVYEITRDRYAPP